jgi:hypothetical protein
MVLGDVGCEAINITLKGDGHPFRSGDELG